MRVTTIGWVIDDIKAGRRLQKPDCGITGLYIISWRHRKGDEKEHTYGLTSLADGMFQTFGDGTQQSLADHLNNVGHLVPVELLREPG